MTAKGLKSQRAVSIGANLGPDTVGQLKHKKDARPGLKRSLVFAYKDVLNNSASNSNVQDQILLPDLSIVSADLQVIMKAAARIQAALKLKGISESDIDAAFRKMAKKVSKDKPDEGNK